MPVQTSNKSYVYFPDGAKVSVKGPNDNDWFDVGAINSSVTATLNWDESEVETANAGQLNTRVSNMNITGGFTLINLDPEGVSKLGGGVFTYSSVAGAALTPVAQVMDHTAISAKTNYELVLKDSNGNVITPYGNVAITTVKDGTTPLTADDDYFIIENKYIMFAVVPTNDVTITYGSTTPVVKKIVYAGSSTIVFAPYAMKIEHVDDNNKARSLELYSVFSQSGGFQFNFKGANEDGVEEMPLTFKAKLDTTKTSGRQLMAWSADDGAM